ncbi:MAG: folate/biopterin family MFS transporter [Propionibacteriaceae bacterium]|jgi:lauroyl/myristoyl acyltransferase|nr:folate/biopterin family MFS transporter [Propionibacteriaceae bacterium]
MLVVVAVPDGGWFGKLMQLLIGLVIIGMVLAALQAALCQVMPYIVVAGLLGGVGWLVWRIVRSHRDRW